jgi:hypothetical protein
MARRWIPCRLLCNAVLQRRTQDRSVFALAIIHLWKKRRRKLCCSVARDITSLIDGPPE